MSYLNAALKSTEFDTQTWKNKCELEKEQEKSEQQIVKKEYVKKEYVKKEYVKKEYVKKKLDPILLEGLKKASNIFFQESIELEEKTIETLKEEQKHMVNWEKKILVEFKSDEINLKEEKFSELTLNKSKIFRSYHFKRRVITYFKSLFPRAYVKIIQLKTGNKGLIILSIK